MFDFTDQVVMITGVGGNLGSAVAQRFVEAGAKLALVARSTDRLVEQFPGLHGSPEALFVEGVDVADPKAMGAAISATLRHFGHLDVLVNTVGGYRGGMPLHETSPETWDFLLNLNARTVFIACRAAIPCFLERGRGKIVNVAARAALSGGADMGAYSAAKSAVVRLTESLSAELKGEGIRVNCVLPGRIDTPQNRLEAPNADFSRWVSPDAIADVVLFLCSDAARAIHGAAVPVYGLS